MVTARIAQQHGLFKALSEDGGQPQSAAALATATNIPQRILDSLLDYMSANYMVEEMSPGHYGVTKIAQLLQTPLFVDGIILL